MIWKLHTLRSRVYALDHVDPPRQIHVVEFDEDSNQTTCKVTYRHPQAMYVHVGLLCHA